MTKKSFSKCFSSRIIKEIEIRFSEKGIGPARDQQSARGRFRPVSRAREDHRAGPLGARPRGAVLPPRGAERVAGVRTLDVAAATAADRPSPVVSRRGNERTRTAVKWRIRFWRKEGRGGSGESPRREPRAVAPWPSAARRGGAHLELGRRRKRELESEEGEAELRARAIEKWRGGVGASRRRSGGHGERGARALGSGREEEGVRARASWCAGRGRCRRARGCGGRSRRTRGRRCRRGAATRRCASAAVAAWRGVSARTRARGGRRRPAGPGPRRGDAGARARVARAACGRGPNRRRRPARGRNEFLIFDFQI
jgi:hypothetical protein